MNTRLSEDYGKPLPDDLPTIWERYREQVKKHPENLALIAGHQPAGLYNFPNTVLDDKEYTQKPYLRWNFKTVDSAINRLATGLESRHVKKGMAFITFISNGAEFFVSALTANKLGTPFSSLSPANLVNMEETAHMLNVCMINATSDKAVIVVQNSTMAAKVDTLTQAKTAVLKVIIQGPAPSSEWIEFSEIIRETERPKSNEHLSNGAAHVPNDECVFFTSGTTSLPKGCRWAHPQFSCVIPSKIDLPGSIDHGDKWCSVMPNNHAYAFAFTMMIISNGAAVCYPSPAFDPQVMFDTLQREKCTHVSLVPTMIHSLRGIKVASGQKLPYLKSVSLGGSVVSPELLYHCIQDLGAKGVENVYGMTDGVFISMGSRSNPEDFLDGDDVAVGIALRGAGLKICNPGESTPIARNVPGELHYSGKVMSWGYVGKMTDDYYTDDTGRRWFKTGDQARMDAKGRIFIIGRYKDVIIRGGKNLASTSMETVLQKDPEIARLNIQIVGAPDPIAGEVPVAVVETKITAETALKIQDTLREKMGREFVPDEVIFVGDLGINQFPRGLTGKVKKSQVAELVKTYRTNVESTTTNKPESQLAKDIRSIWAKAVGLPESRLSDDSQLSDFADSITVMRVRDRIKRQTGRNMTIVEMVDARTIGKQIQLLQSRSSEQAKPTMKTTPKRAGPPGEEDMVHLIEDPDLFDPTKEVVLKAIGPFGFGWDDVQDVLPAYDFATVLAQSGIFDSWNFKFAMLPHKLSREHVRSALGVLLKNNPLFASFLVWDQKAFDSDLSLHVTLRPSKKLLDTVIEDAGAVKTVKDFSDIPFKYPFPKHATFPGPLIRFLIYEIEETKSSGFLINVNHAIIDASYGQIFMEDLDRAFASPGSPEAAVQPHPDYKIWADSYFSLRNSPEARRAVKWHYNRLKNIGTHRQALYPAAPSRVPYDDAVVAGEDGVKHSFEAPGIRSFRQEHRSVTAPIFLKAALVLINIHRTKHTHALFANLEAARMNFPFITKAMSESGAYEATDVAGPTIQSVLNLVEFLPSETVSAFLNRMQNDQTNLTKYASAPWRELMSALGEHGRMVPEVTQSQIYNWVPGMGTTGTNPNANYELLNAVVRPQVGLAINAGMGGQDSSTMFMHLRGDSLSNEEMLKMAKELELVTTWMVTKENWQAPVGEFVEALKAEGINGI